MKKLFLILLAAVALTACKNDNDDTIVYSNFATLESISNQGCVLNILVPDDSKVYTMTASQAIKAENFKAGTRVFCSYTTPSNEPLVSGSCTLQSLYNTEGGGAPVETATSEETQKWQSSEIQLSHVTVTGDYINVIGLSLLTPTKYECHLYLDPETADSDYPELHLVLTNTGGNQQYYTMVGSWSIADIWNSSTCKGLRFLANDPNLSIDGIKIEKK